MGKTTYIEGKKSGCFLIIGKIEFFVKSKCYKSKTDILHTFIVYKIPAKEHQVVDRWAVISVWLMKLITDDW